MQLTKELENTANKMKKLSVVSIKMVKESTFPFETRTIRNPHDVVNLARAFIGDADREVCAMIALDTKNNINAIHIVSIGSLNASIVHPREVMKLCLLANCASYVIFHQHPSGCADPSTEDLVVSSRLKEASEIVGIEMLDFLIIGELTHYSMKEHGRI